MRGALPADVGQQRHEARPLDRLRDGVLAGGVAAGFAAADDFAVAVDQLRQQVEVLVVDEHGLGRHAVDPHRVGLRGAADIRFLVGDHFNAFGGKGAATVNRPMCIIGFRAGRRNP